MQPFNKPTKTTKIALALLLAYLIVRYFFIRELEAISLYSTYVLEVVLVGIMAFLYRATFGQQWRLPKAVLVIALPILTLGFLAFKFMGVLSISLPLDLSGAETLLFLLIIAPILEELIFRFFAWQPLSAFNKSAAYIITSLLFSYSHFHSYWFVPAEFHNFIFYQTIYTFSLALACGYSLFKYNSLAGAILLHFMFNLGFYLGYRF
jgi:membrane protease YdiL (CAAX protease family)